MDIKKQITRKLIQATSDKVELNKQALKWKNRWKRQQRHWEAVKRSRRKEKQGISVDCLYG
ncbi:MAG: hypothetical protein ACLR8P_21525 [Clostridium fessum]